jgi:hypothetical protein
MIRISSMRWSRAGEGEGLCNVTIHKQKHSLNDTPEACEAQVEHMNHGEFKDLLGGGRCVAVHRRPDTTIEEAPGPKLSHVDIDRMRAVFSRNEAAFYRDFEGNPFVDVMQITEISREGVELGGEVYCELTTNRAAVLRKGEMVKVRGTVEFFLNPGLSLKGRVVDEIQ